MGYDYAKVRAEKADGSVWELTIDRGGFVVKEHQITPPPTAPSPGGAAAPTKSPLNRQSGSSDPQPSKPHEGGGWGGGQAEKPKPGKPTGPVNLKDETFKSRLKSIMQDNKFDRMLPGRRKGKLDMNRLAKVETGSTSVFKKKEARKGKEYQVVLVIDQSGSMRERDYENVDANGNYPKKIERAAELAAFLGNQFQDINIDLAVLGFSHEVRTYKSLHEHVPDYNKLRQKMVNDAGGCNHDYDALEAAYEMLRKNPTKGKNLVLFISDGQPATCGENKYKPDGTYIDKDSHDVLHTLVKGNDWLTKTVGIGIQTESSQIPHHVMAETLEQLKPKILNTLKQVVTRG